MRQIDDGDLAILGCRHEDILGDKRQLAGPGLMASDDLRSASVVYHPDGVVRERVRKSTVSRIHRYDLDSWSLVLARLMRSDVRAQDVAIESTRAQRASQPR